MSVPSPLIPTIDRGGSELNSGERLIPDAADTTLLNEHLTRYRFACDFVRDKTVLDAGCGAGYGSVMLLEHGASKVVGVDISSESIAYARSRYQKAGTDFLNMSLTEIALGDNSFDVVVMLEVIEHLDEPLRCLQEIRRVLRDDGILVISSPNQAEHPGMFFNAFHVREFHRHELLTLLQPHFETVDLFASGFFFGSYIVPEGSRSYEPITVDSRFLPPHRDAEPPFFIAVCHAGRTLLPIKGAEFFPFTLDRHVVHDRGAETAAARVRATALELLGVQLTDPEGFAMRCRQVSAEVRDVLSTLVRELLERRDFTPAESLLRSLAAARAEEAEWHYLLAFCIHLQGIEPAGARNHYDAALQLGFSEFWVRFMRGLLFRDLESWEAAVKDLQRAVDLNPHHAEAVQTLHEVRGRLS